MNIVILKLLNEAGVCLLSIGVFLVPSVSLCFYSSETTDHFDLLMKLGVQTCSSLSKWWVKDECLTLHLNFQNIDRADFSWLVFLMMSGELSYPELDSLSKSINQNG